MSLGVRLTLLLVAVSIFSVLAVGLLFYCFVGRLIVGQEKERLLEQAVSLAEEIESGGEDLETLSDTPRGNRVLQMMLRMNVQSMPAGTGIAVYREGRLIAGLGFPRSQGAGLPLYERAEETARDGPAVRVLRLGSAQMVIAAAPVALSGNGAGLVVTTLAADEAVAARRSMLGVLVVSGLLAVGLSLAVGLALSSWLTRPLRRLSQAAHNMAAGSYEEPVTGHYPGEVNELAQGLETMRREVRRSEQSLRGFVASAAHELRTPLTSIAGFSQALLDGTAATSEEQHRSAAAVYRESTRLHRLVDSLLTLSRYDSREFRPNLAHLDVRRLVEEEIRSLEEAGLAEPSRIALKGEQSVHARVDGLMLRQVVANLLHNAVQYGGQDPISAELRVEGAWFVLTVANGGTPIPVEDRQKLFDRFYRGASAGRVEGFGLGLPLVREICRVLGGDVTLLERADTSVFEVRLPLQAPAFGSAAGV